MPVLAGMERGGAMTSGGRRDLGENGTEHPGLARDSAGTEQGLSRDCAGIVLRLC